MHLILGLPDVPEIITSGLRTLCAWLCEFIYPWIADLYQIFIKMGQMVYTDNFTVIYNKISLIIGIFMVFRITFWLIELLVSPDRITDKEKSPGKIVQKVLVAVVMLAITPTIFEYAFEIQNVILEENIIGKIMTVNNTIENVEDSGKFLAAELFSNFYTNNSTQTTNCSSDSAYVQLSNFGELSISNKCLTQKMPDDDNKYQINFDGIFAVATGGFVFWMILMYCINVATRYIQLIYLQVIAPIPIMCYLAPGKDNMFQKWIKQCTATYLDLFIRIAIFNLVVLLSNILLKNIDEMFPILDNGLPIAIFLILGLLTFAKKAPDLIQEILPKGLSKASGDFGLSFKKRTDNMVGGKIIGKGYDKAIGFLGSTAALPFSTGKRVITGIDSYAHGKGFMNGYMKNPGKIMQWVNKQRETLTPESYKAYKERVEGRENVHAINSQWKKGVEIAQKLQNLDSVKDWKKAFDGINDKAYGAVFKNKEFIASKKAVDVASFNEEKLRYAQQAFDLNPGLKTITVERKENGVIKKKTYTRDEAGVLAEDLDKAQKTLKGVESVHADISKQYQEDAATEKHFKFIKNNATNPANPDEKHETVGIAPEETSNKKQIDNTITETSSDNASQQEKTNNQSKQVVKVTRTSYQPPIINNQNIDSNSENKNN